MRLCRFISDDVELIGFYDESRIVPVDQAVEAFREDQGLELLIPVEADILDLLPPDGVAYYAARDLAKWVEDQSEEALSEISTPTSSARLLHPIAYPSKILLLAGNYAEHIAEGGGVAVERRETFPYVFMKPPTTTLTNPGGPVVIPRVSPNHIDWECELGVIIGKACRGVSESDALGCVAGYTVVNDISDRKFQPNPNRKARERDKFFDWMHGKWHDTFCPMGPCVLSADAVDDPQNLSITLSVNDVVRQNSSTAKMVFPVAAVVSFISQFVTLEPGDIISTGTPSGVGSASGTYLKPGDILVASIEKIGRLVNHCEAER